MNHQHMDTSFFQVFCLVVHQCNERAYNQANSFHCQGRNLKANRFAAACWEDGQAVVSLQYRFNDFPLQRPETIVPPIVL